MENNLLSKRQNKPINWAFLTVIFIYPLLFNPFFNYYENFETPKVYFLVITSFILFLGIIFSDFILAKYALTKWMRKRIVILWLILFSLYTLFSLKSGLFLNTLYGSYTRSDGLISIVALTFMFFISYFLVNFNGLRTVKIFRILIYSGLAVSLLGILQFILVIFDFISNDFLLDNRVTSTFGQPNIYGAFLASIIPLLYCFKSNKWVLSIILFGAFLSFSKSIVFIIVVFLAWSYIKNLNWNNQTKKKFLITTAITVVLIFLLRSWIYWFTELNPSLYQLQRLLFFLSDDNLRDSLRANLWQTAVAASANAHFLGYGKGNIDIAYHLTANNISEKYRILIDSSHNLFFDVLLEAGILGLTAICYFYVKYFTFFSSSKYTKYCKWAVAILVFRGLFDITPISLWTLQVILIGISIPSESNI